ncbi:MAG: penicillin-binding protein activator [Bdellovibrionales bacterium]|nr:penicillin-binding protein activator [Bdellovibrionales bacterium]
MSPETSLVVSTVRTLRLLLVSLLTLFSGARDALTEEALTEEALTEEVSADERSIGYILPLTGDAAVFGIEAKRGLELAESELKTRGIAVRLLLEDEKCLPKDAVSAWHKLDHVEKVSFIVGPSCTGSIVATAPLALHAQRPLLALWDAGREVEQAGEHVYSLGFDSEMEGELVASYLMEHNLKRASVLWEEDKFAELVKESFKEKFLSLGGEVVSQGSLHPGDQQTSALLLRLARNSPDAFFVSPAYSAVAILKAIRNLQIRVPIFGQDTFGFPGVLETAGDAKEGLIFANIELSQGTPEAHSFFEAYRNRFHEEPQSLAFAAFGYDSLIIAASLPPAISEQRAALSSLQWKGALPKGSFREGRMIRLAPTLFQVSENTVKRISPS